MKIDLDRTVRNSREIRRALDNFFESCSKQDKLMYAYAHLESYLLTFTMTNNDNTFELCKALNEISKSVSEGGC